MASSADSFDRALWWKSSQEPPLNAPVFSGTGEADIAIIGGGYTGLSAALHLAEAGHRPVVLEARHVGFGATGRNGGQVIPGLKHDPDELLAEFGPNQGQALIDLAGGAADLVFDLVDRHQIICAPTRSGWIQAAHSRQALTRVMNRARQWQERGVPVELLTQAEIAARTGTNIYHGGWRDPRAGSLNPLAYARGLARAAKAAGASIFESSSVALLKRKGAGWEIRTHEGVLNSRQVLVATNGYTSDLVPGLKQSILPVQSMLIATEVLPAALRDKILPRGVVLSETRKLAFYMRQSIDGRLVFGGRGSVGTQERAELIGALSAGMVRTFPDLQGTRIETSWSGHLALTMDGLPHLHAPEPGLFVALGYNGRGIALSTAFGKIAALWLSGEADPVYPVTPIKPIGWHRLREPVMNIGIRWYWLKDRMGFAS
ncbi:MAG TPA: FAD-binding oxidoreductase [Pseudorhizobium sp.]|jgi:sarcosine oxidase|nr:FAD-binding oxidoreductase [Pseudorhizobium sp.]